MIRRTDRNVAYPIALLLSNNSRKTCEALGKVINASGDFIAKVLDETPKDIAELVRMSKSFFKNKKPYLL